MNDVKDKLRQGVPLTGAEAERVLLALDLIAVPVPGIKLIQDWGGGVELTAHNDDGTVHMATFVIKEPSQAKYQALKAAFEAEEPE